MKAEGAVATTDFEIFYDRAAPDGPQELACLLRSVRDISDEAYFETKEISNRGNVTYQVIAWSGDVLILTARSRWASLSYINSKNDDPELDIEEAADCDFSVSNPHS